MIFESLNKNIMQEEFKEKVALVTGGSFGIGKATAITLSKKCAKIVVADCIRDEETWI
ncbi:SDR family NAD(P)-dependent oxidoreductase [Echinicola jeungdonensis]|uniref:SDR family NAD(P)-dependent oxidoreductase n=1 Tax=Echinicola jeungdonensis TaxID=709343 RepID=UPI0025B45E00|nr:SDR family NAD(P)-dependent oxidoreductase [Echinicola jeungdonensis]MDN3671270.1 SDR family NAD(P)-dependent oxidoreductase [Echinicola jeungdonensis]